MRMPLALVLLAVLLATRAHAQHILDPQTYTSPSGQYELFVDPSDREGVGPATLTMSKDGQQLWQREQPFTLWHAHITDDGRAIGYTYLHGREGSSAIARDLRYRNTVDIVFCDAAGDIIQQYPIERKHPAVMANPPAPYEPMVNMVVPVPSHDLVIVKLLHSWDDSPEDWLLFRFTTGDYLKTIDNPSVPEFEEEYGFVKIFNIQPIGDLPLVARHAYIATFQEGGKSTDSAHISVLDLDGNQLWGTNIHNEYQGLDRGWRWNKEYGQDRQLADTPNGFTFHSWSAAERITFACERDGEGWTVAEVGRQPAPFGPNIDSRITLERIELELAGTITLGASQPAVFGHVGGFDLDSAGNIGLVPWQQQTRAFTLVSPQGQIIHRNDFAELGEGGAPWLADAVWAGNEQNPGRWLLYQGWPSDTPSAAAWYDTETRTATPLQDLNMPRVDAMCPMPDGGVAVLGAIDESLRKDIVVVDASGKRRWMRQLFSPNDITVTSRGEVVAVDVIRHELLWFSPTGTLLRTTDLDETFERDASYPTAVNPDADGGVIVHDFGGDPTIYRITPDGKATASFTPTFEDGRAFVLYGDVIRAPDGALWTSDSAALLELDNAGVVRRVVGEEPSKRPLREIRALTIGPNGDIYAVNEHNAAIHVFDSAGTPKRILTPGAGVNRGPEAITVDRDGLVYGQAPIQGEPVRYDADGTPMRPLRYAIDTISEEWLMQPLDAVGWAIGYEHAALFEIKKDDTFHIIRAIERRPDNTWIGQANEGAVAADGSLALIASEDLRLGTDHPKLCVYDPKGTPITQFDMPGQSTFSSVAFVSPYIVTFDNGRESPSANLYDIRTDAPPRRIVFPESIELEDKWWLVHPSPNPGEFLLRSSDALELYRIRLPKEF
ncbi:MAG: hypothetical protein ACIAQU_09365 [Phycisphaerales bacterium JB064]